MQMIHVEHTHIFLRLVRRNERDLFSSLLPFIIWDRCVGTLGGCKTDGTRAGARKVSRVEGANAYACRGVIDHAALF